MVKQGIGIFAIVLALPAFADRFETGELDSKLDPNVAAKLTTATINLSGGMTADAAYNVICERAGLEVIFDPRFEPQKMWVEFRGVKLRDALELVGIQLHMAWRVVAPHTIVVVPVQSPHPNPPKLSDPLKLTPHHSSERL
jgi:hypothetical protein